MTGRSPRPSSLVVLPPGGAAAAAGGPRPLAAVVVRPPSVLPPAGIEPRRLPAPGEISKFKHITLVASRPLISSQSNNNTFLPHSILQKIARLTCFSDSNSCRVFAIWSSSFCRFSSSCLERARCCRRSFARRRQSRFCRVSDVELCSADEFKSEMHEME